MGCGPPSRRQRTIVNYSYFAFLNFPMDSVQGTTLLFGIFLILSSSVSAGNTSPCVKSNACYCILSNGTAINLESLALSNNSARFRQQYNKSGWMIYNPCKPFNGEGECQEAAACFQEEGEYSGLLYTSIFGKQDTSVWTEEEGFKISYIYKDRNFQVSLVCNKTTDDSLMITDLKGTTIKAELTSKCACAGGCPMGDDPSKPKHSLSTGSIILILFFALVVLYLLGGLIYNKIINGATGKELIPNVEFWTALPKLVLDGVAFACNCCGKRKSTPGYDNV